VTELISYIFQTRCHVIAAEVLNSRIIADCGRLVSHSVVLEIYTHPSDGLAASIFRVEIISALKMEISASVECLVPITKATRCHNPKCHIWTFTVMRIRKLVWNTVCRHHCYRIQPDLLKRNLGITETCSWRKTFTAPMIWSREDPNFKYLYEKEPACNGKRKRFRSLSVLI
jgi:hypothetical protein